MNATHIVFVFEYVLGVDASETRQCTIDEDHTDAEYSDMYHTG